MVQRKEQSAVAPIVHARCHQLKNKVDTPTATLPAAVPLHQLFTDSHVFCAAPYLSFFQRENKLPI